MRGAPCSHSEACGKCHSTPCAHMFSSFKLDGLFEAAERTGPVGSDLTATIQWRQAAAADQRLPAHVRDEHQQMADWLVELKNLRTLLLGGSVADRLSVAWRTQLAFMALLKSHRGFNVDDKMQVDVTSKSGQRLIKEIAQDAAAEIFEAIAHLKNAKLHRATDVRSFDRDAFIEELVDAFKFLLEVAILSGVALDEFWAAFEKKTRVNNDRISSGY